MSARKPLLLHKMQGTDVAAVKRRQELYITPAEKTKSEDCRLLPPTWLDGEALAEWRRIMKNKQYKAILTSVDRAQLVSYCICWEKMVKMRKEDKFTAAVIFAMNTVAAKLGMTPTDRTKIQPVKAKQDTSDDPWEQLMANG